MKAGMEFLGFTSVALVAHLAMFSLAQPESGQDAGGAGGSTEGGAVSIPLTGADPQLAALVRQWEEPLVQPPAPPAPMAPPQAAPPPDMPRPTESAPAALPALPQAMQAPRDHAPPPPAETQTPQLYATPEELPQTRPRPRPERSAPQQRPQPPAQASPAQPVAPSPTPSPAPSAPSSRAQGADQGQGGQGGAETRSGSDNDATLLAQWGGSIRAAIQRQQRGPGTSARGTVQVQLQVSSDGRLVGARVVSGSGNAALDRAAMQAVQRARLPRAPSGIRGTHGFNLPLTWR